ncbi:MAG: hypothetical protein V3V78_02650 [Candidatus Woesearchaeota archaeon]
MSLKGLLGLDNCGISEFEIMQKVRDAQRNNLGEIDFEKPDGTVVKIFLPTG